MSRDFSDFFVADIPCVFNNFRTLLAVLGHTCGISGKSGIRPSILLKNKGLF